MPEPQMQEIGRIEQFFAQPSAAIIALTAPLRVGETIYVKGHTTDFQQVVESIQIDRQTIPAASAGQAVGVRMKDRCRKHDVVYKLGV